MDLKKLRTALLQRPRALMTILWNTASATALAVGLALGLAALLATTACGGGGTEEAAVEARTYQVRGVVRSLPSPDRPGSELMLRHEAIPDFEDVRGEAVGMDAMTMGFPVADEALLDGISPGDAVAFTLSVDWDGSPPVEITALEKLPPGTELAF